MLAPEQFRRKADFRGVYPNELNEELAFHAGRYLIQYVTQTTSETSPNVLVGRDGRLSSPAIYRALIEGIATAGGTTLCAGLASTDMIQWGTGTQFQGAIAGVMVTASHNPPQYNGIKMLLRNSQTGGVDIIRPRDHLLSIWESDGDEADAAEACKIPYPSTGRMTLHQDFIDAACGRLETPSKATGRLVLDPGNGVGGIFLPLLKEAFSERGIDVELSMIFNEIDGRFPNRPPNPGLPAAVTELQRKVPESGAKFGAAFDGDADRVVLVDEHGEFIPGSQLLGALATRALAKAGAGAVVFASVCSFSVIDAIRRAGGTPVLCKVGQDSAKVALTKTNAVFGGESSAHYNFPETYGLDSGLFALMMFWDLLLESGGHCSTALAPFACWSNSGEVNFRMDCADWQSMGDQIIEFLRARYAEERANCYVINLDGVGVYFPRVDEFPTVDDLFQIDERGNRSGDLYRFVADGYRPEWWFNVRASNNEPLLRVNFESRNADQLSSWALALVDKIHEFCKEHGARLEVVDAGELSIDLATEER